MTPLAELVRPGATVAVGDGFGAPRGISAELSAAAAAAGGVRLILGWLPKPDAALDFSAFDEVVTVMPGWGLRDGVASGAVRFPPVRLSTIPALLHGAWRPDLLIASVVGAGRGFIFGSEISWQRAAIDAGAVVAGVLAHSRPRCDAGPALPPDQVIMVGESTAAPLALAPYRPGPEHAAIARRLAPLIPAGARLQVGPGPVATALLAELSVPVRIDSGMLPDPVVELAERGLLQENPTCTYLAGGPRLYAWADGRPLLRSIEYTHDIGRLSADRFFAVNTAIEIDHDGQVNVEGTAAAVLGGIGGHGDYATAGARSIGGLSIIAMTTAHGGRSTLVPTLSCPVSTPSHDVDMVVTEVGGVDLRGLSRPERRAALVDLWSRNRELPQHRSRAGHTDSL
ncbi:acetyl-CoA hydrolase/transferase C-terminal domain-containing protein [Nocardia miyunensis]|uniref:acetyl-CoA hydrolase/transferase C-terminal domain-containing protein n=1 Tax=Nocardia miyunensis TaxID=282684 RepID=UPI00082F3DD1|nr:acetyl-CoA hydrolase/transferase C-terminal domain-containing protein [Nocardia miyunensis]